MGEPGLVELEGAAAAGPGSSPPGPASPGGLYQVDPGRVGRGFDRYLFAVPGGLLIGPGSGKAAEAPGCARQPLPLRLPAGPRPMAGRRVGEPGDNWKAGWAGISPGPPLPLGRPGWRGQSAGAPVSQFAVFHAWACPACHPVFGVSVQAVPRLDAGYVSAPAPGTLRRGAPS